MDMANNTIVVKLQDGYKLKISKYAKQQAQKTGGRFTISDVVRVALKKLFGK